jgi:hypothetical protein
MDLDKDGFLSPAELDDFFKSKVKAKITKYNFLCRAWTTTNTEPTSKKKFSTSAI